MLPDLSEYEHYLDLTQARVRYYEAGSGTPLLLLHGMGPQASADSFQFLFESLAEHYHVLALDLPGFGRGDRKLAYGPTFDVIVDGLREFIDVRKLAPVNIVAHSAGGWFAGILAYESPERVRKLVLIATAGLNIAPAAVASASGPPSLEDLVAANKASVYEGSAFSAAMAEAVAAQMFDILQLPGAAQSLAPLKAQMSNPDSRQSYLLQRRLPYIYTPVLMVWGENDMMEPFPTWTVEWHASGHDPGNSSKPWVSPNMHFALLDDATHFVHWEQPEKILELVHGFID